MSGPTSHPWAPKCIVFQLSLLVDPNDRTAPSTADDNNNNNSNSKNKAPSEHSSQDTTDTQDNVPVGVPGPSTSPAPSLLNSNKDNITRGWSSAQNVPNPSPPAQALLQRVQKKNIRVGIVRDQSEVQNVVQSIGVIPWLVLFVGAAPAYQRPPPGPLKRKDTMRTLWLPPVVWEGGRRSGAVRLVEDAIKQYL
ncbi:hypothetical protein E4U58_000851 [Claviceps cyperi]|nr:hypothetical protein E4U58_000851 [Claviceps cyperi]